MVTVGSVTSSAAAARAALSVLSALQLTGYLWPQQAAVNNGESFDFIVVGAGAAGSIVASRLTENGKHTVLLIEAGGDPPLETEIPATLPYIFFSKQDWGYETITKEPIADYRTTKGIYYPNGKMIGGSGAIFLHVNIRSDAKLYNDWAAQVNDSSWNYDSVLPYFEKSEHIHDDGIMSSKYGSYHGTKGPMDQQRLRFPEIQDYLTAFEEIGDKIIMDKNNGLEGVGYVEPFFTINGEKVSHPARSYLSPAKDRKNLFVLKNTLATKVLFEGKTAKGIEVLDSSNKTLTFYANKEVILSAGALNTPQLLMLSGVGPKKHLESFGINVLSDLPVGENFVDLFGTLLVHKMKEAKPATAVASPYTNGPIFIGFPALDKSQTSHPDYMSENFILSAGASTSAIYCTSFLGFKPELCQKFLDYQQTNDILVTFITKLDAKSKGKIMLRSANPTDAPVIYDGFLTNEEDQADIVKYVEDYTRVINTTYFKSVGAEFIRPDLKECKDFELYTEDYWNCYIPRMLIPIFKYQTSCQMGEVVDTKLKVYGVEKLRVIDASVTRIGTRSQNIATVIMIAEKGADMILQEYA
ncbi:GMC oxidoreductase domain-containing protein [Phthorimaea operculella]|nr:GMC oxidoreductase domain-containing protein [Phthorimaea operculella]